MRRHFSEKFNSPGVTVVTSICTVLWEARMLDEEEEEGRKTAARWEKLRHEQFANIIRTEVRRRLAANGGTILSNYTTLSRRCRLPAAEITLSRNWTRRMNARIRSCIASSRNNYQKAEVTRTKDSARKGGEEGRKLEEKREETRALVYRDTGVFKNLARPRKSLGELGSAGHDQPLSSTAVA
ncbi:hypothetical protein K0M31_003051 [Melipona bicolor]|uniref:Uncharacterized protein n=1 Tax=Melipona bicolor TaxID=60889 RepID=A0AA40KQ32_9HYME|nr:hypothetical protein K0M31_003051 [Melipona bicolor]